MPMVNVKENESFETALRRFKRACEKAGIIAEMRSREFYEKPTWEKKRKKTLAIRRLKKKIARELAPLREKRIRKK